MSCWDADGYLRFPGLQPKTVGLISWLEIRILSHNKTWSLLVSETLLTSKTEIVFLFILMVYHSFPLGTGWTIKCNIFFPSHFSLVATGKLQCSWPPLSITKMKMKLGFRPHDFISEKTMEQAEMGRTHSPVWESRGATEEGRCRCSLSTNRKEGLQALMFVITPLLASAEPPCICDTVIRISVCCEAEIREDTPRHFYFHSNYSRNNNKKRGGREREAERAGKQWSSCNAHSTARQRVVIPSPWER